jgi:hypothetical protein
MDEFGHMQIYNILQGYKFLPHSFSNQLLEQIIRRAETLLMGHYESKFIRLLDAIPLKRLSPQTSRRLIATL